MSAVESSMIRQLRSRLRDDRATVAAFSVSVAGCESALLEVSGGVLSVEVIKGSARSLRMPFSSPEHSTIERLAAAISRVPGYSVTHDPSMVSDHTSFDLVAEEGICEIAKGKPATLKHRLFSDSQLRDFVSEAGTLHNPNYVNGRVPPGEQPYVLLKAQAKAYRVLAAESARKAGGSENAQAFLNLANDLDSQYSSEVKRLTRVIPRAKTDESKIGSGDIVVGTLTRSNPRTGLMEPMRGAQPADPPVLFDPQDGDVQDTLVKLRWRQNREDWFSHFELWRDTVGSVERNSAGKLGETSTGLVPASVGNLEGTSVQVLGRTSASSFPDAFNISISQGNACVDGADSNAPPVEPDSVYYYRLYAVTINGDALPSNVVKVQTKGMRAKLATEWADVKKGLGGVVVTLTGTNFHSGMSVSIGGKLVSDLSVLSATSATFVSPAFSNPDTVGRTLDVVVTSSNGLAYVLKNAWSYVA